MKIENFHAAHLRNDEHFQFHTEFRDLVVQESPQTLDVKALFDAYLPLYEREDTALKKINKSAITKKIQDADKERDAVFVGFNMLIRAHCHHFSPDLRNLAEPVRIVLDTYGHINIKSMDEQTSAMYNLVQELSDSKYQEARTNFGLTIWLNKLKTVNEAYEALVKQRDAESTNKSDIVMKDARQELDDVYRAIVERVNAFLIVGEAAKYENFAKSLNTVIGRYSTKLHHRRHHHDAPQAEENEK
jgi:hypothetical protein